MFFVVCVLSLATICQNGFLFSTLVPDEGNMLSCLCALMHGVVLLGYAFWARSRKTMLPVRRLSIVVSFIAFVGGLMWSLIVHGVLSVSFSVVASGLVSCGRGWALALGALAFSQRGSKGTVVATVSSGIACSYFLEALAPGWFQLCAPWVYCLSAPISLACTVPLIEARRERYRRDAAPRDLAIANPDSFPGLRSRLYICVILFELTFGASQSLSASAADMAISAACSLFIVGVLLVCVRLWPRELLDRSYAISAAILMGTLLLLILDTSGSNRIAEVAGVLAPQLFRAVTWAVLVELARHNPAGGFVAIGLGFGLSAVCAALGFLLRGLVMIGGEPLVLVLTYLFFLFLWFGMRGFSFERRIEQVFEVRPVSVPAGNESASAAAVSSTTSAESDSHARDAKSVAEQELRRFAKEHKLTPRETDVFVLLAQGRDVAHIESALYITRNTVKTHVRHIYEKLAVHTQQELIDLVA